MFTETWTNSKRCLLLDVEMAHHIWEVARFKSAKKKISAYERPVQKGRQLIGFYKSAIECVGPSSRLLDSLSIISNLLLFSLQIRKLSNNIQEFQESMVL